MIKRDESKLKVTTAIRQILLKNSELLALVGEKIFPLYAPEGTEGDFVLYVRDEYSVQYTAMWIFSQQCRVFINVVSDNYDRSQDIAELILGVLEGDQSNGLRIRLKDSAEDYEDKKFIQVLLFEISNS